MRPAHLVAAVLAFLPFAPYAYARLQQPASSVVRYGWEVLIATVALVVVAREPAQVFARVRPLVLPVGVLAVFWLFTDVWNDVSWRTAATGLQSELRYLPAAVLAAAAAEPLRDLRLYARILVAGACLQAVLAVLFAVHIATLQTTLADRNQLGVFLMLAALVFAARFPTIGHARTANAPVALTLLAGVVAAGSREGAISLAAGLIVLGLVRLGRRGRVAVVAVAVGAAGAVLAPTILGSGLSTLDSRSVVVRWRQLFQADLSPSSNFRVRLLVDNAKLVAREEPVFGVGLGTASAPAVIEDLTSPVYRSFRGFDLKSQIEPYVYDSNWATIVLETGFVGTVISGAVLVYLGVLGLLVRRLTWAGPALTACVAALVVACFAGPALREPLGSIVLWLLAGAVVAALPHRAAAGS